MSVFFLKRGDTKPVLEVALKNPDGTPVDLTGTSGWKLHIRVSHNTIVTRDMTQHGALTDGILRYAWTAADWTGANALPSPVRLYRPLVLEMEYEVLAGLDRMRFPNNGYDKLKITGEVVITEAKGTLAVTLANARTL
jgi:hypothetical protein